MPDKRLLQVSVTIAEHQQLSATLNNFIDGSEHKREAFLFRQTAHHGKQGGVGVFARLGWLHRSQDVFRGTPVLVGGGNWIYATPGVGILVGKGINVQAEVKLPLYRSL